MQNAPTQTRICTRQVTRRQTRNWRDCRHINADTSATCEVLFPAAMSDCGSDAKTGATHDKNVTLLKMSALPVALKCFENDQIVGLITNAKSWWSVRNEKIKHNLLVKYTCDVSLLLKQRGIGAYFQDHHLNYLKHTYLFGVFKPKKERNYDRFIHSNIHSDLQIYRVSLFLLYLRGLNNTSWCVKHR